MLTFQTSTGAVQVDTWGYELQGTKGKPLQTSLLASATHDLLVIDASHDGTDALRFTKDEITRMKDGMGGRSVVVSYVSIGEASDFRDYWRASWTSTGDSTGKLTDKAPGWLGPVNPDWPESRKIRYWDADWQKIIFNDKKTGELDAIVKAGFDAAYLDIVDGYYFWGAEVSSKDKKSGDPATLKQAAQRMVDFIVDLTDHARETNPNFFVIPQNGGWILNDLGSDNARKQQYLKAIGGIAIEDLYYRGDADENNALNPDKETIAMLKRDFLAKGKPVFVVDYLNDSKLVADFNKRALKDGFIPFAAPDRDLDQLVGTYNGEKAYIQPTAKADTLRGSNLADTISGLAGDDRIDGRRGNDVLNGNDGNDILKGGSGDDKLYGGNGADKLYGGSGKDILSGGAGKDTFVFDTKPSTSNVDRITDFNVRDDVIWLDDDAFAKVGKTGNLKADAFTIGTKATDAEDRIIYDKATGKLFYDADGNGKGVAIQIALLDKNLALTAADFIIIA